MQEKGVEKMNTIGENDKSRYTDKRQSQKDICTAKKQYTIIRRQYAWKRYQGSRVRWTGHIFLMIRYINTAVQKSVLYSYDA